MPACGTGDGVERPRARVRLETDLRLTEAWALDAKTKVTRVAPYSSEARDKCTVTLFHIDVTDHVMKATREKLSQQVRTLDRALAQVQTRERFERWWRDISRPIKLTDSIYLTINPRKVQLGGVTTDSGEAVAHVRMEATPRIRTGSRPNDFELFTPLPPLQHGPLTGEGMRVSIQGEFGYDIATGLLRKALIGRSLSWEKRNITIRDVTVAGIGGGKVALGVRFGGAARGLIYLTGTPSYDNLDDQILIPDLAYDLHTNSMLVKGLAYLGDDQIRDALRQYARFPITGHLDRLRTLAVKGMNRELTKGVELDRLARAGGARDGARDACGADPERERAGDAGAEHRPAGEGPAGGAGGAVSAVPTDAQRPRAACSTGALDFMQLGRLDSNQRPPD